MIIHTKLCEHYKVVLLKQYIKKSKFKHILIHTHTQTHIFCTTNVTFNSRGVFSSNWWGNCHISCYNCSHSYFYHHLLVFQKATAAHTIKNTSIKEKFIRTYSLLVNVFLMGFSLIVTHLWCRNPCANIFKLKNVAQWQDSDRDIQFATFLT